MQEQTQQLFEDIDVTALQPSPTANRANKGTADRIRQIKALNPALGPSDIGRIVGTSHSNVVQILARYNIEQQETEGFKEYRGDILAGLQHRILKSITDEDIKKSPMGSRVLAVAQLYDKERLERGLSTNNIDAHLMLRNDQTLDSKLQELQALVDNL